MDLSQLLSSDAVLALVRAPGKKHVLQELAERAAALTGLDAADIFTAISEREKLGGTGVGEGVALPHARIEGLERCVGVFAKLDQPIDFEAFDGRPADLVFLLLAPTTAHAEHLKALAGVSRFLRRPGVPDRLRQAGDRDAVFTVLVQPATGEAA